MRPIDADALLENLDKECGDLDLEYNSEYEQLVNYIESQPTLDNAPKWISVNEKLPESTDVYLINAVHRYNKSDGYRSAQVRLYFKDDDEWHGLPNLYEVTHWMPIPEPPKED